MALGRRYNQVHEIGDVLYGCVHCVLGGDHERLSNEHNCDSYFTANATDGHG